MVTKAFARTLLGHSRAMEDTPAVVVTGKACPMRIFTRSTIESSTVRRNCSADLADALLSDTFFFWLWLLPKK